MNRTKLSAMAVVGLVLALVLAACSSPAPRKGVPAETLGGESPGAAEAARLPTTATEGAGGPAAEGIKVHGHWTIEVREPDGNLVSRTEFDNALQTAGATWLSQLLGRQASVGFWRVSLNGSSASTQPCNTGASTGVACVMFEPNEPGVGSSASQYRTLAVTTPGGVEPNAGKLVLSGTVTAQITTNITVVQTFQRSCTAATAPSSPCSPGTNTFFTGTTLPSTGVAVTAGQLVAAQVVIGVS